MTASDLIDDVAAARLARFSDVMRSRPAILAPMEDVTDAVFRRICRSLGAGPCVTEFVNVEGLLRAERSRSSATMRRQRSKSTAPMRIDSPKQPSLRRRRSRLGSTSTADAGCRR
jgi:Dihydrouridine synthase (Dus)